MCHDVGGVGIAKKIPPLVGNPRVQDKEYLAPVIREGLIGPIEVDGQTYDEEMDGFPEMPDAEVAALIAYIQSGFPDSAARTHRAAAGGARRQRARRSAVPPAGSRWRTASRSAWPAMPRESTATWVDRGWGF